jgi:hypothetical protein
MTCKELIACWTSKRKTLAGRSIKLRAAELYELRMASWMYKERIDS